jgi:acyl-CoA synthetase (NDP forming)
VSIGTKAVSGSFQRIMQPGSIAVFGGSHAGHLIQQCDRLGFQGAIWPVHPEKTQIEGRRVYRAVDDLPGSPDACFIGVNRHKTIEIVRDLAEMGAGGAVCFASGFNESGEEGRELARQLLVASGDMPLIGPNCYGLLNFIDGAALWPDQQGARRVDRGVAIISMSSNVAFNLTMQRRGLPIAYMLCLGNKLKFDLQDAIRIFAENENVTAIGLYLESVSNPAAFEDAVRFARKLGKPVVAIKTGRSETARQLVLSHTASMAGPDELVNALFSRSGVARVYSLEALVEALKVLHLLGPLDGGRIGIMSTSGGDLALVADAMEGLPLDIPELSAETVRELRSRVHPQVRVANPFDFQMWDWNDPDRLSVMFEAFMRDDFDAVVCVLDYPRADRCDPSEWSGAEEGMVRASRASGTPGVVLSTFSDTISESIADRLIAAGVVPLTGTGAALEGLAAAVTIGAAWKYLEHPPLLQAMSRPKESIPVMLDEAEALSRLAEYGVRCPQMEIVTDPAAAMAAARRIGYPVVVKALGIAHKTESGAVRLNLENADAVATAVEQMAALAERFIIAEMIPNPVCELIVGVHLDQQFGPTLLVGFGGVLVEILNDYATLLLPASRESVLGALLSLKSANLLQGYRNAPVADMEAAVDSILAIARFAEDHADRLLELDVNPLLVLPEGLGAVAVDALVSFEETVEGDAR